MELSENVVEAVELALQIAFCKKQSVDMFLKTARLVVKDCTTSELHDILQDCFISHGFEYKIDRLPGAIIMLSPWPNTDKTIRRPVVYFDCYYASGLSAHSLLEKDRQSYLHFLKTLHELTHAMTNNLIRLRKAREQQVNWQEIPRGIYRTPNSVGTLHARMGDMGSGFEEEVFGGRVIPCHSKINSPFTSPLQLRCDIRGKAVFFDISDKYIAGVMEELRTRAPTDPLPNLTIPARHLTPEGTIVPGKRDRDEEDTSLQPTKCANNNDRRKFPARFDDVPPVSVLDNLHCVMSGDGDAEDSAANASDCNDDGGIIVGDRLTAAQQLYYNAGYRF